MNALVLAVLLSGSVSSVREHVPQLDAHKRGRLTSAIRPALEALGPAAVPQMIEAFAAPRYPTWSDSASLAWQASLLEAIATFADPQARPLFVSVVRDEAQPVLVQRAAAEGLAKLGDVETLVPLLSRDAVVSGAGACRKLAMASALAAELAKRPAAPRAKALVRALSEVGNAWAWKTLKVRDEELAVRDVAARALIEAFTAYGGEVRQAASNALLVVDSPSMPALMAGRPELEAFSARLKANPVR